MTIPDNLILMFFNDATSALNEWEYTAPDDASEFVTPPSLSEHRQKLLGVQRSCLQRVVSDYCKENDTAISMEEAQSRLRDLSGTDNIKLKDAMDRMNDSARLAFCRVVLDAECIYEALSSTKERRLACKNSDDGPIERSAILEFCGLCNAAVRLEHVQIYLQGGNSSPLLNDCTLGVDRSEIGSSIDLSQRRLERIQQLLFRAIGYDPEHAASEIRRMGAGYYENDIELHEAVAKCLSNMTVAATNASIQQPAEKLSDHDSGGVTRVVSVQYSEQIVDSAGSVSIGAPQSESIQEQVDEQQRRDLLLARQAASLQQEILEEILTMSEQERDANLQVAREAHDAFLKGALEIPAGPQRVDYLRSVNSKTQRLLLIHKLWGSLAENGQEKH